jgi:hypothetical protein
MRAKFLYQLCTRKFSKAKSEFIHSFLYETLSQYTTLSHSLIFQIKVYFIYRIQFLKIFLFFSSQQERQEYEQDEQEKQENL